MDEPVYMYATNPRTLKVHAAAIENERAAFTLCGLATWRDLHLSTDDFEAKYVDCGTCQRALQAVKK